MNLDDIFIIYLPNFFLNHVNASSIIEITNKGNARSKNIYIYVSRRQNFERQKKETVTHITDNRR